MMDEHFMRGWTHGHERLSADLDRGLKWLRGKADQFADAVVPSHASGQDVYFVPESRTMPVRAAKRR
ncbi:hypothetical protein [Sphingopyxis sp.]|uniref:hypothetical protein n=1 Tax=Sphingopyxis sp. TaxID=1908224 RepID=UPI0035B14E93